MQRPHDTAVAVVGGRMTGALVAHAFATADIPTTVLEAAVVGNGSTAASSALLLKEPDLELKQLANHYGGSASRRIWELSLAARLLLERWQGLTSRDHALFEFARLRER